MGKSFLAAVVVVVVFAFYYIVGRFHCAGIISFAALKIVCIAPRLPHPHKNYNSFFKIEFAVVWRVPRDTLRRFINGKNLRVQ